MIEVGKIYSHPASKNYYYVKYIGENINFMVIRKNMTIANYHWLEKPDYSDDRESHKYFVEIDPVELMKIKSYIL